MFNIGDWAKVEFIGRITGVYLINGETVYTLDRGGSDTYACRVKPDQLTPLPTEAETESKIILQMAEDLNKAG
jgi:hypothetical protein